MVICLRGSNHPPNRKVIILHRPIIWGRSRDGHNRPRSTFEMVIDPFSWYQLLRILGRWVAPIFLGILGMSCRTAECITLSSWWSHQPGVFYCDCWNFRIGQSHVTRPPITAGKRPTPSIMANALDVVERTWDCATPYTCDLKAWLVDSIWFLLFPGVDRLLLVIVAIHRIPWDDPAVVGSFLVVVFSICYLASLGMSCDRRPMKRIACPSLVLFFGGGSKDQHFESSGTWTSHDKPMLATDMQLWSV